MSDVCALHDRFAVLVAEHQAWLRAYVRTLGVASEAVDDVAQEVFLIAYRRYAEYDPERPFAAWLKGIAKLLSANERRRHQRRGRLIEPALAEALAAIDEVDEPGDDMALAVDHLRGCLEQLPERSRELLRLRYEDELDASALGAKLGRDGNAVRQALFRVRELVRRCVEGRLTGSPP